MTLNKNILTTILAFVLFALAGCVSTPTTEGTGAYVEDSVITGKVKAVILNEPSLKSREINVETFKGVVQLSGFACRIERCSHVNCHERRVSLHQCHAKSQKLF